MKQDQEKLAQDFIDLWLEKHPSLDPDDIADTLLDLIDNEDEQYYKFSSTKDAWLKQFIIELTGMLSKKASTGIFINPSFLQDVLDSDDDDCDDEECPHCKAVKEHLANFDFQKFRDDILPHLTRVYDIVTITQGTGNTLAEINIVQDKAEHGTTITDDFDFHGTKFKFTLTLNKQTFIAEDLFKALDHIGNLIQQQLSDSLKPLVTP